MPDQPHDHSPSGKSAQGPDGIDFTSDFSSSNPAAPVSVTDSASLPLVHDGRYEMLDARVCRRQCALAEEAKAALRKQQSVNRFGWHLIRAPLETEQ